MFMLNAPQWKSKIVGAWMQLLQVEDARVLIRWIVPYVLLYVKCEPINRWPEQRQPERALLVQSMADAIAHSGVDHFELTKFIEELTQSAMPSMPSMASARTVDALSSNDNAYQQMILGRRIKRGLRPHVQKPRTKCTKCGRAMLTSSMKRHMRKFHLIVSNPIQKDHTAKKDCSSLMMNSAFQSEGSHTQEQVITLTTTAAPPPLPPSAPPTAVQGQPATAENQQNDFFSTILSCESTDKMLSVQRTISLPGSILPGSNMTEDAGIVDSVMHTTELLAGDVLKMTDAPSVDWNQVSRQADEASVFKDSTINLWQFPSRLLDAPCPIPSVDTFKEKEGDTCRDCGAADDSDASSVTLPECNNVQDAPSSRVLRHRVDLPKLQPEDHADLGRLLNELSMYYQLQGRTSSLQPKLLITTLCRLLLFAKQEIHIEQLRYLDNALDVTLKTPRILIPYISSYTMQTPVASSIRNEVNRIRDLLRWRTSLLLIGSADDLARRQMNSMEAFLKKMQSSPQRMVVVKTAEEIDALGMWSTMEELRGAVRNALQEIREILKDGAEADSIELSLKFQQTVIACAYVSLRPQRRSVWRDMKVSHLQTRTFTSSDFKTTKSYHYLSFTFPDELYNLLKEWVSVFRPNIVKRFTANGQPDEGWLFVTLAGAKRDISSDVSELFFAQTGKIINPTRIRSIYRTEVQTRNVTTCELEILDSADCHGREVVNRHYLKPDRVDLSLQADNIYERVFGKFVVSEDPQQSINAEQINPSQSE